ncbi:MTAP family purine nucleoside phosphorylase [Streptomyces sp900105755]|uniref:MTAP family purine nucleoside phosphorylase n=1 Tax=Streptomyces sp. 900105755 TaxID=3154389 RepID=A0ABV1TY01_9ACTN
MAELAIVGSQDVDASEWLDNAREVQLPTRDSSVKATVGTLNGYELIVMPRNSSGRPVPPHAIDYRANMDALSRAGVRMVLTTAMVGTLRHSVPNGSMLVLDQFIDFTKDRQFTFFSDDRFGFADMTEPYCPNLRAHMIRAGESLGFHMAPRGCCVCVPGPRFETRAEVRMFAQLGGDVIGHTNGTDCIMAREAGMCFATFAGVITLGAGLSDHDMNAHDWHEPRRQHAARFRKIVGEMTRSLRDSGSDVHVDCRCATAAPIEK